MRNPSAPPAPSGRSLRSTDSSAASSIAVAGHGVRLAGRHLETAESARRHQRTRRIGSPRSKPRSPSRIPHHSRCTEVDSRDDAVAQIESRELYGAILLDEPEVLVATAASPVSAQALRGVATQLQAQITATAQAALVAQLQHSAQHSRRVRHPRFRRARERHPRSRRLPSRTSSRWPTPTPPARGSPRPASP